MVKPVTDSQESEQQDLPSEAATHGSAAEAGEKTRAGRGRRKESVEALAGHIEEQQESAPAAEEPVAQEEVGRRAGRGGQEGPSPAGRW